MDEVPNRLVRADAEHPPNSACGISDIVAAVQPRNRYWR
jgi:hypothetical protein